MWKWRRSPSGCLDEKLKLWAPMQVVFIDFDVQTKLCSDTHGERERMNMRKIHRENSPAANDLWFRLFKTTQIVYYTHTPHIIAGSLESIQLTSFSNHLSENRVWSNTAVIGTELLMSHCLHQHTTHNTQTANIFEWVRFIGFWWFSVFPLLA